MSRAAGLVMGLAPVDLSRFVADTPQTQGDQVMTEPPAEADPWLTLSEAASRTGRHIDAVRSLVRRRKLPARKGNNGQWLVQLPQSDLAVDAALTQADLAKDAANDQVVTELLAEVAELREALARAEVGRDAAVAVAEARVEAAKAAAAARVDAARASGEARAEALRELADRLTSELAEAKRPWWLKWRQSI